MFYSSGLRVEWWRNKHGGYRWESLIISWYEQYTGLNPRDKKVKKKGRRGFINKIKPKRKQGLESFLVADIETILKEKGVHEAYAAGVLKVTPGEGLPEKGTISTRRLFIHDENSYRKKSERSDTLSKPRPS